MSYILIGILIHQNDNWKVHDNLVALKIIRVSYRNNNKMSSVKHNNIPTKGEYIIKDLCLSRCKRSSNKHYVENSVAHKKTI